MSMGVPSFPLEDQTDEDFFDKLVDDEVVDAGIGSEPGLGDDNVESSDVQTFAKLSVDEVGTSSVDGIGNLESEAEGKVDEKGCPDDSILSKGDGEVQDRGNEDGGDGERERSVESLNLGSLSGPSDHDVGAESANVGAETANVGGGVKEVQWSEFGGIVESSSSDFFNEIGDNSTDPFGEAAGEFGVPSVTSAGSSADTLGATAGAFMRTSNSSVGVSAGQADCSSLYSYPQNEEYVQHGSSTTDHATGLQDQNSTEYWESLYPGWRYDSNSGQWYQVDNHDAIVNNVEGYKASSQSTCGNNAVEQQSDAFYLQQTAQSVSGTVAGQSTTGNLSYWNQTAQVGTEYPAHMVFDPQYPGWYYDTIAQEWRSLDSYVPSKNHSTSLDHSQNMANGNHYKEQNMAYGLGEQVNSYSHQQNQVNWEGNGGNNYYQDMNMAQSADVRRGTATSSNGYTSNGHVNYSAEQGTCAVPESSVYEQPGQGFDSSSGVKRFQGYSNGVSGYQNLIPEGKSLHQNSNYGMEFDQQYPTSYLNSPQPVNFTQQPLQSSREFSYSSSEGRTSAGRPPHALVTFGFGGKLIVMKTQSTFYRQSAYESQDSAGGVINVLNLMDVAVQKTDGANVGFSAGDYFHPLCHQSFPGPLVSNNVGSRELNRWIDDRIANCAAADTDYKKGEVRKMLFSLLKIACQYYGRLRSAFGGDNGLKENDCPESALAKLFASMSSNASHLSAASQCLQNVPSEGQTLATAEEVQMLLVSGRKMEALQCAQQGHLWGLAIVIAALLGEQYYGETVKQMALQQLVAGSPLRTLCLLLAGQPAEVFSNPVTSSPQGGPVSQTPQVGPSVMLDGWEDNLAIISANRTKGDELVITHLGDCLWRERSEVMAAHICYLVAEANIEPYSESARLCLVGADHLKFPRTYAGPEAIQRTEIYEYAKVLGNSQFILMPFQPYKLIYACMLAEVGKLTDSLKYCQSVLKSLKAGRSPEVDACRAMVTSLEERIKIHQQGGYTTNLAPAKLVGRLLNFFDHTAHRVVGGLPPPIPSASHNGSRSELDNQSRGPRVSTSQSTMAISSLMPSASTDGNSRKSFHNRSVSEPNIGRTPRKVESPEKSSSTGPHDNNSVSGSRFGRFGSQIFQKTVGLVLRSRSDRQAKLGDTNKFYYDEKLKRWVEEGVEPPAEEAALAPPPTTASFMNGVLDHDKNGESVNGMKHSNGLLEYNSSNSVEKHAGTPPIPSGSNQFSAGGRMGVRARYVDTFNKGGGAPAKLFHSPSPPVPAAKPATSNAKFFIPTPVAGGQESDSNQSSPSTVIAHEDVPMPNGHYSFSSPTPPPTIHRHPSMERISNKGMAGMINGNGTLPPHSRRTLSWSGGIGDTTNHFGMGEARPLGEALGFPPSTYMSGPSGSATQHPSNCTTVTEDLQEVEL